MSMPTTRPRLRQTALALVLLAGACGKADRTPEQPDGAQPPSPDAPGATAQRDHAISLSGEPIRTEQRAGGLSIEVFAEGSGPALAPDQTGLIAFEMRLADGRVLDSSERRAGFLRVPLVEGSAVPGLLRGLEGMRVGGQRRLRVPSELGYGKAGRPPVPAGADLIFDVELIEIIDGR